MGSLKANPHIITLRRRLATELACPVRPKGLTTTLFNRNSTSCLIGTYADVLSWLRLRTVFRASKPYRRAAGIRSPRRVPQLDTWFVSERAMIACGVVLGSRGSLIPGARAPPSLAGTRSLTLARSDHPRLRWTLELELHLAVHSQLSTLNFQLIPPLSCRWRSDWPP